MTNWTTAEGSPFPLGASWVEKDSAWNFALYSEARRKLPCCSMRKPILSIPFSATTSITSATNPEGSGTAGYPWPSSAALATTPIRWPAPTAGWPAVALL